MFKLLIKDSNGKQLSDRRVLSFHNEAIHELFGATLIQ